MRRILAALRRGGWAAAARTVKARLNDGRFERRLGVRTAGLVPIETLLVDWDGCHDYFPTAVDELGAVLAWLEPGPDDVFLDIGAGMGRAMIIAATFPFRRIQGLEISPELCDLARANFALCASTLSCEDLRVLEGDAAALPIPDDVTVIYLYNPFHGDRLRRLFENIAASLRAAPRSLHVLYNNPRHFEAIEHDLAWLERVHEMSGEYPWRIYRAQSSPGSP